MLLLDLGQARSVCSNSKECDRSELARASQLLLHSCKPHLRPAAKPVVGLWTSRFRHRGDLRIIEKLEFAYPDGRAAICDEYFSAFQRVSAAIQRPLSNDPSITVDPGTNF